MATHNGISFHYTNKETFDFLYEEIFIKETYKFTTEKKAPIIIDCGSNIGISILYFKNKYPHAKILAFEPHKHNVEILKENISSNNLNDVVIVDKAVSHLSCDSCDFWGDFSENGDTLGGTINKEYSNQSNLVKSKVNSVCLSEYITEEIDLLKLDVEGVEDSVLLEIEHKLYLVDRIHIEVHFKKFSTKEITEVCDILKRNNFSITTLKPEYSPIHKKAFDLWSEETGIDVMNIYAKRSD